MDDDPKMTQFAHYLHDLAGWFEDVQLHLARGRHLVEVWNRCHASKQVQNPEELLEAVLEAMGEAGEGGPQ